MDEKVYTSSEVAEFLQVSIRTVRLWAEQGLIAHGRTLGGDGHLRFKLEDINAARQKQGLDPLTEDEAALLLAKES